MKKYYLQSHQLDDAFRGYKTESTKKRRSTIEMSSSTTKSSDLGRNLKALTKKRRSTIEMSSTTTKSSDLGRNSKALSSTLKGQTLALFHIQSKTSNPQDDKDFPNKSLSDEDAIVISASDLEIFLNISRQEAEKMIFLADQDKLQDTAHFQRTIDRDKFQQLLQNWS